MDKSPKITHFRRYHGYDYSRGAVEFVTFHLERRIPTFGTITQDGKMILSQAGKILEEVILHEGERDSMIDLMHYQIMPEHLHMRLYIHPNANKPLYLMGQFISNTKRWSMKKCNEIGINISWQKNYHDHLCISREIIDIVDEYMDLNPLKWSLMNTLNPPMNVIEPLYSPLLPNDEWWTGVGNANLLNGNYPLFSIRLSRKLPLSEMDVILPSLIDECFKGFIPISTFISPMEMELFRRLSDTSIPIICAVPDPLKTIYRPKVNQTILFAQNRLLLISHIKENGISRECAWHSINNKIAEMAQYSNGKSVYLH